MSRLHGSESEGSFLFVNFMLEDGLDIHRSNLGKVRFFWQRLITFNIINNVRSSTTLVILT